MASHRTVPAAGGVVFRPHHGTSEIALVHRPRYDDWSLPKGKLEPDEHELLAAVREIGEETGARVELSRSLGRVRYAAGGITKDVGYWAMRYRAGALPTGEDVDEVDAVEWLPLDAAAGRASYDADREVIKRFAAMPAPDGVVVLVRHAKAGKRSQWKGEDSERPLERDGRRQARALAGVLAVFAPATVVSADRVRCVQTVEPLADALGLRVRIDERFSDEAFVLDPQATCDALLALGRPGSTAVVSSQGVTIPALIDRYSPIEVSSHTRKAAFWVLSFVDGEVVAVDRYDAP